MDAYLYERGARSRAAAETSAGAAASVEDPFSLDLFGPVAHARRSDPSGSHEAAASHTRSSLRASQLAVHEVLRRSGPLTDEELVERYTEAAKVDLVPMQSPSGIRTRRAELAREGEVRLHGRGKTNSGRSADIWAAVNR